MSVLVFDIETGPLPEEELRRVYSPPKLPPPPGEFVESAVKTGNLKDREKIAAKIEEARKAHQEEVGRYASNCDAAKADHWQKFVDGAALSATTGCVLAIGLMDQQRKYRIFDDQDESELLAKFWTATDYGTRHPQQYIGFNIEEFDIPFLARRSWYHGLDIPLWASPVTGGRWFGSHVIDLRNRWRWGNMREQTGSLDDLCRFFGVARKLKDESGESLGKRFHELWTGDRPLAVKYLQQDLECTLELAARMRVI